MKKFKKLTPMLCLLAVLLLIPSAGITKKPAPSAITVKTGPWIKCSVDFKGSPLEDVVRFFRVRTGRNIIVAKNINQSITATIKNMYAWQIFTTLLAANDLDLWQKGEIWIITKLSADKKVIRTISVKNTHVRNVFRRMNILLSGKSAANTNSAADGSGGSDGSGGGDGSDGTGSTTGGALKPGIRMFKTGEETILMDRRLNAIIIMGRKAAVDRLERVIDSLDIKIKDVLIRMKVIEIALTKSHQFGIDWTAIGDVKVASTFPANFTSGSSASINFGKVLTGGAVGGKLNVTAILKMLASNNETKILATPILLVANNKKSKISLLTRIPYEETQANEEGKVISKQFKEAEAGIKLEMQPTIFKNYVKLTLNPKIDFALGGLEYGKKPILDSTHVETELTIKDGDTIIIGGLLYSKVVNIQNRVPLLGSIPILGRLFSSEEKTRLKKEVAIFITVNIVDHDPSATRKKEWARIKNKQWKRWSK